MTIDLTRFALWARPQPGERPASDETGPIIGMADHKDPVRWPVPSRERAGHVAVLGSSGSGKTVLMANALVREITASRGAPSEERGALCVVDPKGDLVQLLFHGLAACAPDRLQDVCCLDPFSEGGFPFNLCHLERGATPVDIRALQLAGLVAEVSTATGAQAHLGVGARQLDVLQNALLGALACPHPAANVLWSLDALSQPKGFAQLAAITSSPRARAFLESAKLNDELRASCAARIRTAFGATESLERLVAAPGCIQFSELLAPGRITLVDLGRPTGGLIALQTFYANLLVRLAVGHLLERPSPWPGHFARVVIDEAQVVAPVLSDLAEVLLTTGRSRAIAFAVASQGTTLINAASPTLLRVLMSNTPLKLVGRLNAQDAELLARERAPGRGIEEAIGAFRSRLVGQATNLRDREFFALAPGRTQRFVSSDVALGSWEEAAAEHQGEIEAAKHRLALSNTHTPRVTLSDVVPAPARRRGSPRSQRANGNGFTEAARPRSRWG